jgi:molybdate transport system substrate-binding protein
MKRLTLLVLVVALLISACAAQELTIAAASDLQFALQKISDDFQKQTGITVKVTFGSSGNLTTQIENGAPFDLFFSADSDFPKRLIKAGQADPGSFYEYATGKLVLWVRKGSTLDLTKGLQVLTDPKIGKISIANPTHAPYGRAAVAAMKSAQVYDRVSGKLVLGENISQAAQYVQTGAADIGLIALSLALAPSMNSEIRYALIPANAYPPIDQAAAIVAASKHKAEAQKFLAFMKRPQTLAVMRDYGFNGSELAKK